MRPVQERVGGRGRVARRPERRGEGVDQECVAGKTRVPFAALGVEDLERRRAPRRAVAVVGDEREPLIQAALETLGTEIAIPG